jgi:flagellar biosynthesis/type III secretory pathway protein FliH
MEGFFVFIFILASAFSLGRWTKRDRYSEGFGDGQFKGLNKGLQEGLKRAAQRQQAHGAYGQVFNQDQFQRLMLENRRLKEQVDQARRIGYQQGYLHGTQSAAPAQTSLTGAEKRFLAKATHPDTAPNAPDGLFQKVRSL